MERIREHVAFELNLGFLKIRKINIEVYQEMLSELDVELDRAYVPDEGSNTSRTDMAIITRVLGGFFDGLATKVRSLTESDKVLVMEDIMQRCSLKHGVVWSQIILMAALQMGHLNAKSMSLHIFSA